MKIGLIADTHDNLNKLKKAVKFFNQQKVDLVLHAGDYIAPFAVALLNNLNCDYRGVFGNNDGEKKGLRSKSGNRIKSNFLKLKLEDLNIALVHDLVNIKQNKSGFDLIIYGHTHKPSFEKINHTLMVNPGECGAWLSNKSTVAIVELKDLKPKLYSL